MKYIFENRRYQQLTEGKIRTTAEKLGYSQLFATAYNKHMKILSKHSLPREPWWLAVKGVKWNRVSSCILNISVS